MFSVTFRWAPLSGLIALVTAVAAGMDALTVNVYASPIVKPDTRMGLDTRCHLPAIRRSREI